MHPFGAWLANTAWAKGWGVGAVARKINDYRASNGEEMHGYMWQSLRLLALDFGRATDPADWTTAPRKAAADIEELTAARHIATVCGTTWPLSPQSRDDCFHGAAAWSKWPSWRGHYWPPRTRQTASEGVGAALRTREERPSVSDPSERP